MATKHPSVVCDTHVLVWYLTDPERLSEPATLALEGAVEAGIIVSSVTLVELVYASEKKSEAITPTQLAAVLAAVDDPLTPFTLVPVDVAVAQTMQGIRVREPEQAGTKRVKDPFDRTILATAIALDLKLVTADRHLLAHHAARCTW